MATFKYKGELPNPVVLEMGKTMTICIPQQDGSKVELTAPTEAGWQDGDELPHDFTDARALRILRSDPRFEEI